MFLFKNKTIFTIILTACLLSLIVPFVFLSYFSTTRLHHEAINASKQNAVLFSDFISIAVKNSLVNTTELIKFTAESLASINPEDIGSKETATQILNAFVKANEGIYDGWFVFEPGVFQKGYFARDFIREDGKILPYDDDPNERLQNEEEGHWYYRAFRSGEIYFDNEGFYDYGEGEVGVFTISMPIKHQNKPVGVVGMDLIRRQYYRFLDAFQVPGEREILMISATGQILYSSQTDYDNKNLFDLGLPNKDAIVAALSKNLPYSAESYSPVFKDKSLISIRPLNLENVQQAAFLYVDMPSAVLFANTKKMMGFVAIGTLISGIILFFGILLSTKYIVIALKKLTNAANEIAEGNYDVQFTGTEAADSKNEIVLLQHSLRKMLDQLKRNIKEREQFSITLEQRIEERTRELKLMREESEAAKERAEQASSAKGDFLARMSHEIRTPINAIMGMCSIGRTSKDIEKKDYCLEKIDNASTHLLGIINDILDISKIEANKLELSYSEFNFEKTISKILNVIKFQMDQKKQKFFVNIASNIPTFMVSDEQHLSQVISNLLSNAIKFTPEHGTIVLTVSKKQEENKMATFQIDVKDSGIGISEEQQKALFQSFQQADNSISRKYGGTGLGLAISKSIVKMMGGNIWIASKEGEGAIFSFTFNAKLGSELKKCLNVNRKIHVLIVNQSKEESASFYDIGRTLGFEPDSASSQENGLKLLQEKSYDLVLIDSQLPGFTDKSLQTAFREKNPGGVIISIGLPTNNPSANDEGLFDRVIDRPLFVSSVAEIINWGVSSGKVSPKKAAIQNEKNAFKNNHLLLVEDVDINREIVISLLADTGIQIDSAENGTQAIEMYSATPDKYDLIFMDIQMPGMDGYTATKEIRTLSFPSAKTIPIVAMTANVFREDIQKSLDAGMNAHLGKPINLGEVMEILNKYLRKDQ